MKYICKNCQTLFIHPTKLIKNSFYEVKLNPTTAANKIPENLQTSTETCVCPQCLSHNYDELTENQPEIANVYVYDLSSGPQSKLDELLSQGYKIAARYSKQYILEKPKETQA
jgi:hypothetical protein